MERLRSTLALLGLVIALSPQVVAGGGPGVCCICSDCPERATACSGPLTECGDLLCQEFGCREPVIGTAGQCAALAPCAITEPAPTTSAPGMVLIAAGLGGFGVYRLARRKRV